MMKKCFAGSRSRLSLEITVLNSRNSKEQKNIYFAGKKYVGGILEAIEKYDFIEKAQE